MKNNKIYIAADHDVKYYGAKTRAGEDPINDGTCTFALKDKDGTTLGTGTAPYVAASDGDYLGILQSTATALMVEGDVYYVEITFSGGSGYNDFRRLEYVAAYRGLD